LTFLNIIDDKNQDTDEDGVKRTSIAFLLVPLLSKYFKGPTALENQISKFRDSANIVESTLQFIYSKVSADPSYSRQRYAAAATPSCNIDTQSHHYDASSTSNPNGNGETTIRRKSARVMAQQRRQHQQRDLQRQPSNNNSSAHPGGTATTTTNTSTTSAAPTANDGEDTDPPATSFTANPSTPKASISRGLAKRIKSNIQANQISKAVQLIDSAHSGNSVIRDSDITSLDIEKFLSLHPQGIGISIPDDLSQYDDESINLNPGIVDFVIRSSKKEIASAFSPWSNELIKLFYTRHVNFRGPLKRLLSSMFNGSLLAANIWNTSRS